MPIISVTWWNVSVHKKQGAWFSLIFGITKDLFMIAVFATPPAVHFKVPLIIFFLMLMYILFKVTTSLTKPCCFLCSLLLSILLNKSTPMAKNLQCTLCCILVTQRKPTPFINFLCISLPFKMPVSRSLLKYKYWLQVCWSPQQQHYLLHKGLFYSSSWQNHFLPDSPFFPPLNVQFFSPCFLMTTWNIT